MKSYLSLADIQAKVHRRQNRMTIFCIALSVFLVTGVFSMADMEVRNQTERAKTDHGNWHIMIHDIPEEEAGQALRNENIEQKAWYDVVNYNLDRDYYIHGKPVCIAGVSKDFEDIALVHRYSDGSFPSTDDEVEISQNIHNQYDLNPGDIITIDTPAGAFDYVISGFIDDTSGLLRNDSCGVFMTRSAFDRFCKANGEEQNPMLYVRFRAGHGIKTAIARLRGIDGWEDKISENSAVLGAMGMSSNDYIVGLYGIAAVLMMLVILAGVLMISGSMNSNVSERTRYFGMLRCIGAGKRQIKRLVRREALNWCKIAVPAGELAAVIGVWIICAVLHYGIGGEWEMFPVFEFSAAGLLAGAAIGVATVLLAANSPAGRAARVSPVEAVSADSCGSAVRSSKAGGTGIKIDTALGIRHAFSSKKRIILMTGSFALSILLFMSFSVMIDWIGHALNTTKPYSQDMTVYYDGYSKTLPKDLAGEIEEMPGIRHAYGRMHLNTSVTSDKGVERIDLLSYEDLQFAWAKKDFLRGDMEKVTDGDGAMTVFAKDNPLTLGDTLIINGREVRIEALLSDSPFSPDGTPVVLCSEMTFTELTGTDEYAIIDVQVEKASGEETAGRVRELLDEGMRLSDVRREKQEANNTYMAFSILVYGFLSIIAMIAVVNIINSVSMSVAARSRQYGIMRAAGMDGRQVKNMILSEALSYAVCGCVAGCAIGLPLNAFFFKAVISNYWGDSWKAPLGELSVILIAVLSSAFFAAEKPSKKVMEMAVIDTINAR